MAASIFDLQENIGRGDNDNWPNQGNIVALPSDAARQAKPADLNQDYENLSTRLDADRKVLFAEMTHPERACFTPGLMRDGAAFIAQLQKDYGCATAEEMPFRYLVWTSRAKGAWSLGGDLSRFTQLIREQDADNLRKYARKSVDVLYENHVGMGLPIQTIALIQGDAIGGGFEAMLTNDIVIAERGTKFGLPEILFNLFPGMGAQSFLERKVGPKMARLLIEDGLTRTAEELHEIGLVDIVAEPGEGEKALDEFLHAREKKFNIDLTLKRVRQRSNPVTKAELVDIVDLWVELALQLTEDDLRRMTCLARHQQRRRAAAA